MNDEGTDKAPFTLNEKEVGLYVGNVGTKYVVEAPTAKRGTGYSNVCKSRY